MSHSGFHGRHVGIAFEELQLILCQRLPFLATATHGGHLLHLLCKLLHSRLAEVGARQGLADRLLELFVRDLLGRLPACHLRGLNGRSVIRPLLAKLLQADLRPHQAHDDFGPPHLVQTLELPLVHAGVHHSPAEALIHAGNDLLCLLLCKETGNVALVHVLLVLLVYITDRRDCHFESVCFIWELKECEDHKQVLKRHLRHGRRRRLPRL
mmetsp:Transcript_6673/g.15460  ORF Transcript_6673/g.15460 Transcript_6673/m.15460 type:complete len:211 (+) Transcript_6673:359-991(+)